MTLADLQHNQQSRIVGFTRESRNHTRLQQMGVLPGALATVLREAPLGDPLQVKIDGTLISIRKLDARQIQVEPE